MINVEALKSILLKRRSMRVRFKFPMPIRDVHDELLAAVMAEVEFRQMDFVASKVLDVQLWKMAKWLTCDKPKFGIILCGLYGNGKSTFMKAFQQLLNYHRYENPNNPGSVYGMRIIHAKEIAYLSKEKYDEFRKIAMTPMLGIDDLGVEAIEVLDFGNVVTPLIDLISIRYEEQLFTMITTNLKPNDIRERYGDRIADRFNEMLEKIVFENPSYRTSKKKQKIEPEEQNKPEQQK